MLKALIVVAAFTALSLTLGCTALPPEAKTSQAMAPAVAALQAQLSPTPLAAPAPAATAPPPASAAPAATRAPGVLGSSLSQALASAPPVVGQPVAVTTEAGEKLTVTVNAIVDPAPSSFKYNQPKGRFVVLDWSIRNDGSIEHAVSPFAFQLQTADGFMYRFGISAGLPQPDMHSGSVGPGQSMRGYLAYDVPAGSTLKSAIYQPLGNRQFVIAGFTP